MQSAADPRLPRSRPLLAGHVERPLERDDFVAARIAARCDIERLAHREEANRDDDDVHAVEQLVEAEGEARLACLQVDADQAEIDAEEQASEAADGRRCRARRTP